MTDEELLNGLKFIEDYNSKCREKGRERIEMNFDGVTIGDPFMGVNGLEKIENPIKYYGKYKLEKWVNKFWDEVDFWKIVEEMVDDLFEHIHQEFPMESEDMTPRQQEVTSNFKEVLGQYIKNNSLTS